MNVDKLKNHALHIRKHILSMVYEAQSGHIGGSLSAVEIVTYLYFYAMDINSSNLNDKKRDRFVLSKGHATPLLYGVFAEKDFLSITDLKGFRQINSNLQGHPNMQDVKGIDMSTGSLGQGISAAVGMALANRLDCTSHYVYALLGDGECEEGEVWEAAMCAAHYNLDHLCVFIDHNHLQIDGDITKVMNPTPLDEKFEAFGWQVFHVNGHDFDEIHKAVHAMKQATGKPTLILADTIKGKGVSFMENKQEWHGSAPNKTQYEQALQELRDCYGSN